MSRGDSLAQCEHLGTVFRLFEQSPQLTDAAVMICQQQVGVMHAPTKVEFAAIIPFDVKQIAFGAELSGQGSVVGGDNVRVRRRDDLHTVRLDFDPPVGLQC